MPFYYECYSCNTHWDFDPARTDPREYERQCEECSEFGCPKCIPEALCDECADRED